MPPGWVNVLVAVGTGLLTTLIIAACGFFWRLNTQLTVIVEKLGHIDYQFTTRDEKYEARFKVIEKDVTELESKVEILRGNGTK